MFLDESWCKLLLIDGKFKDFRFRREILILYEMIKKMKVRKFSK